jgi:hypothetical protein
MADAKGGCQEKRVNGKTTTITDEENHYRLLNWLWLFLRHKTNIRGEGEESERVGSAKGNVKQCLNIEKSVPILV